MWRRAGRGLHIMLDTEAFRTPFLPGWSAPTGGPRTLLCFEFDAPAGVDAKYAELVEAGYGGIKEPFDAMDASRSAVVDDHVHRRAVRQAPSAACRPLRASVRARDFENRQPRWKAWTPPPARASTGTEKEALGVLAIEIELLERATG